jgi:hypothetical protein
MYIELQDSESLAKYQFYVPCSGEYLILRSTTQMQTVRIVYDALTLALSLIPFFFFFCELLTIQKGA